MDLALGKRLRELPGPILVTGHTGFKGTWLSLLLERLNIPVIGLSLAPEPGSLFALANRTGSIPEAFIDIRDFDEVNNFLGACQPSAVIHLAAQPIVLESYQRPRVTFETNVMGTVNLLDAAFKTDSVEVIVVATTDKVYRNDNLGIAFTESDALAGKDPYSASKVGTEAAVASWQQISKVVGGPKVIAVRAGNVIGGGDWAENRLMPDLIRGFMAGQPVEIRNPDSTRPWQHVLDPLIGYLMALDAALSGADISALNFGPEGKSLSVREVINLARKEWGSEVEFVEDVFDSKSEETMESATLSLDSTRAHDLLGWAPVLNQVEAVMSTVHWWNLVMKRSIAPENACEEDIDRFLRRNV